MKRVLEQAGFSVTRSSASLGIWDLVAVRRDLVLLVQVKTGRFPRSEEFDRLLAFEVPDCCLKLLVIAKSRKLEWYTLG